MISIVNMMGLIATLITTSYPALMTDIHSYHDYRRPPRQLSPSPMIISAAAFCEFDTDGPSQDAQVDNVSCSRLRFPRSHDDEYERHRYDRYSPPHSDRVRDKCVL